MSTARLELNETQVTALIKTARDTLDALIRERVNGPPSVATPTVATTAMPAATPALGFDQFVVGSVPVGDLLLRLRRAYAQRQHNMLELLYALYGSADMLIRRV